MNAFVVVVVAFVCLLDTIGSDSVPVVQNGLSSQNEMSYNVPCETNADCPYMLPTCKEVIQFPEYTFQSLGKSEKPNKKCACKQPGYQFNSTSNACQPGIWGNCLTSNEDCVNNTVCQSHYPDFHKRSCSCLPGFHWKKHEGCILDPDQCLTDEDCVGLNVKCEYADNCHQRRKCRCEKGFGTTSNNRCSRWCKNCTSVDEVCCFDNGITLCTIASACNETVDFILSLDYISDC